MVDALGEIHRVLAPGGTLVDARPDSRVPAYAERRKPRGFQRFGVVKTSSLELANDRASDRAIARVVRAGLFKRRRHGASTPRRASTPPTTSSSSAVPSATSSLKRCAARVTSTRKATSYNCDTI